MKIHEKTIVFDGACNLCNGVVSWITKNTGENTFHFVPFRSDEGQNILTLFDMPVDRLDTVVFIENGEAHINSSGLLRTFLYTRRWRKMAKILLLVPKTWRDPVYKMFSRNRVKWFGASKKCVLIP